MQIFKYYNRHIPHMLTILSQIQEQRKIKKQSAINYIHRLKKKGLVRTKGGRNQIRFYYIDEIPQAKENGLYANLNKNTPIKLHPNFIHTVIGNPYSTEQAITDCLSTNDSRHHAAAYFLINKIKDWKRLKDKVKYAKVASALIQLYDLSRKTRKTIRMPKIIRNALENSDESKIKINEYDLQ